MPGPNEQSKLAKRAGFSTACFILASVLLNTGLTIITGGIPTHQNGTAITITNPNATATPTEIPKYNSTCLEDLDSDGGPLDVLTMTGRVYLVIVPVLLAMYACTQFKLGNHTVPKRWSWGGNVFYFSHFVNWLVLLLFVVGFARIDGIGKMADDTRYESACLYAGTEGSSKVPMHPEAFMILALISWMLGVFTLLSLDEDGAGNLAFKGANTAEKLLGTASTQKKKHRIWRGLFNLVICIGAFITVVSNLDAANSCGLRHQAFYLGVLLYPTAFGAMWGLNPRNLVETLFKPSRVSLMLVAAAVLNQSYISAVRPCDKAEPLVKDGVPLMNLIAISAWMLYEALAHFGVFDDIVGGAAGAATGAAARAAAGESGTSLVGQEDKGGKGGKGDKANLLRPRGGDMATLRLTSDGGKPNPSGSLQFV
jgi:hypothetical protein